MMLLSMGALLLGMAAMLAAAYAELHSYGGGGCKDPWSDLLFVI
jgi:hypothetical protein